VGPLTNIYGKISTIIVFYAPIFFSGEEHRSRSVFSHVRRVAIFRRELK
jgi:hypothetical protein